VPALFATIGWLGSLVPDRPPVSAPQVTVQSPPSAPRPTVWESHREEAWYACQGLIKQNLRDPDSASFLTDYDSQFVSEAGEGGYRVVQRVRAANGFGGKTLSIFICQTHLEGGNWSLDDLKEDSD
jgi:hypothetical protein